jgi:hypothetical protein
MLTIETPIPFPTAYPLSRLGKLENLLFFDIETTGFSGDYSNLYLIGCVSFSKKSWKLIQWFADTPDSEKELLISFFEFLKNFDTVIHFNGDRFDIPYLLKRCQAFHLPYDFSQVSSIDLYQRIKPCRKLLNLENLKQKSIERFLRIHRQDQYSGGELIAVYEDYLLTRRDSLYDLLMLHNREDLEGMPLILPILHYPDFLGGEFELLCGKLLQKNTKSQSDSTYLSLTLKSPFHLPVPISRFEDWACFTAGDDQLNLEIPLFQGELKHFYPDYEDYYYLIYEDTAIHKSVGQFVDKSARKKASPQTCYTKKSGLFLPQPFPVWEPALKKQYRHKFTYVEYTPGLLENPEDLNTYVHSMIKTFNLSKNPFL